MKDKRKKVRLRFISKVFQEEEWLDFSMETVGEYFEKADGIYLCYEEENENSVSKTVLKLFPDKTMQLIKHGEMKMNLHFSCGETKSGTLTTIHGTMPVQTKTEKLMVSSTEENETIQLQYEMFSKEQTMGKFSLEISYDVR